MATQMQQSQVVTERRATVEDFRRAGVADGVNFAREQIGARPHMTAQEMELWMRDLWFRRIPDHIDRLRAAGAGPGHLQAYLGAVRRGYRKQTNAALADAANRMRRL